MLEQELRQHRCCFTGHRPEKMEFDMNFLYEILEKEIKKSISEGYTTFITGMAPGVDLVAGKIVCNIKENNPNIKLIAANPYPSFKNLCKDEWETLFDEVLNGADLVKYIYDKYSPASFMARNKWMVNHSAKVIAVFNGQPSGTKNTIDYANKNKVPVKNPV